MADVKASVALTSDGRLQGFIGRSAANLGTIRINTIQKTVVIYNSSERSERVLGLRSTVVILCVSAARLRQLPRN